MIPKQNRLLFISFLLLSFVRGYSQDFSPLVKQFISIDADTFALTHAIIVDGTGSPAKTDQTIVVMSGKIISVGMTGNVTVPKNARIIDCTGKTIIPGMIMMHEHLFYGERVAPQYLGLEMPVSFPRLYLAGGVTTMRTAGSVEAHTDLNIRDQVNEGKIPGPDIDVTAPYIERPGLPIPEFHFIKGPDDMAKYMNFWISNGCTSFKVYMDITKDDLEQVIKLAHQHKIKVTGHLCSITYREAAEIGIDNLEHGFWVSSDFEQNKKENSCNQPAQSMSINKLEENNPEMEDLMKLLIKRNVSITSTLPVFEPYTGREVFPGDAGEALTPAIREGIEKTAAAMVNKDSTNRAMFKKEMAWEKKFVQLGGRLLAGIDPTGAGRVIPGYADRHIPELLVEAGFSFPEAIKICTLNAAEYLGRSHEIGTIEPGKQADLVLINGNPLKDVKEMRNTETVFENGVGFDSRKLFDSVKGKVGLH
ncbi:MAG TPA: amidohydrolase family protein [Chitinophagaceae bacterium]|nr:amidohydrolase family protein [Chitinophagaceae bacterium]